MDFPLCDERSFCSVTHRLAFVLPLLTAGRFCVPGVTERTLAIDVHLEASSERVIEIDPRIVVWHFFPELCLDPPAGWRANQSEPYEGTGTFKSDDGRNVRIEVRVVVNGDRTVVLRNATTYNKRELCFYSLEIERADRVETVVLSAESRINLPAVRWIETDKR